MLCTCLPVQASAGSTEGQQGQSRFISPYRRLNIADSAPSHSLLSTTSQSSQTAPQGQRTQSVDQPQQQSTGTAAGASSSAAVNGAHLHTSSEPNTVTKVATPAAGSSTHPAHAYCPELSAALLAKHAKRNTVMLSFPDFDTYIQFGPTFLTHTEVRSFTKQHRNASAQGSERATHSIQVT